MSNSASQQSTPDWANPVAEIAGVVGTTVFHGRTALADELDAETPVYDHVVSIRLEKAFAHRWPEAFTLLEEMCLAAAADPSIGVVKYRCALSRDTRKGVLIKEQIVFTDPAGIDRLKAMPGHDAFVAWLIADNGRANWFVLDDPAPYGAI